MSKMSELLIESQETGKTVRGLLSDKKKTGKLYRTPEPAQESAKASTEVAHPNKSWGEYWRTCLNLVICAGRLSSLEKLEMNWRDESKRHNILKVVNDYYNGKPQCIFYARRDCIGDFWSLIDKINSLGYKLGIAQVSGMKLLGVLEDPRIRAKFRHHISKHLSEEHPPFELDELPSRDFRKTK